MSRVAKNPIPVPAGTDVNLSGNQLTVKGSKGTLQLVLHSAVEIQQEDGVLQVAPKTQESREHWALAGTFRALVNNMVIGVSNGFEKKLQLVGVGYRAQAKGKTLNLSLGFSHPVDFEVPEDVSVSTPSPTEIVVSGCDKQKVGQVAAVIRSYRPPEPYKGKGIRYFDEHVVRKEAKKK